ncbi:MAG: UDP-N-acetylmuramoyl-L-alanyl-D-glutamate--2,6-diaminopimelate ligase [Cyanobacteria bacterium P01_H01_bin.15]
MKLSELLALVPGLESLPTQPAVESEVTGLTTNSQAVNPGELFIGLPGTRVDGGEFWAGALASGAIAAVISKVAATQKPPTADDCVIVVDDLAEIHPAIAAAFNGFPGQTLKMIGVTGTNGKTTTTHLIEHFLCSNQQAVALFGTLYTRWSGFEQVAVHTTPFPVKLQQQLAAAVAAKNQYAVMEVSSHALDQGRVKQCPFAVSVFTNLTQDHLDYHTDMETYFAAKRQLFSPEYLKGRAIINLDDPYGERLLNELDKQALSYSIESMAADFYTEDLAYEATGVSGTLCSPTGKFSFTSPLVGQFNLANVLAAVATVAELGVPLPGILNALKSFVGVPGRMERVVVNETQNISVIVDYAHTPDSLENMLKAARPFIPGKMICVFGCGGDRDRTKRPLMGGIAAKLADTVVVTSDNPRTEDPEKILADVVEGIPKSVKPLIIGDRAEAIAAAIAAAEPHDGVLIAGKGHEDYQILGTEKIHFDDREQARAGLSKKYA